ncbi:MAG: family 78 glycoside hydrolase catalytic domain [Lachnospirales bacterium]
MKIANMRVEGKVTPIDIDVTPSFTWNVVGNEKNWEQSSYRIIVGRSKKLMENIIWDTGWKNSSLMNAIFNSCILLCSNAMYFWKVLLKDKNFEVIESDIEKFETAFFSQDCWHGKWIGEKEDGVYKIYRKKFLLNKEIKSAKLFISGLGHYTFKLNNKSVSDRVLEPGWTNYNKTCFYSTYNITSYLNYGENAIGVFLGDGMYNVSGGRYVYYERSYGKCKMMVQMNITYTDGTTHEIFTDNTWKVAKSPLTFSCIYGGEDYDGRLEQDGFSHKDFLEDDNWEIAQIVNSPKGILRAQVNPPLKVKKVYEPVAIEELEQGAFLYDFGRNFSGRTHLKLKSNNNWGQKVTLVTGELLDENKIPNQKVTGMGYHWQYTMNEKYEQDYTPMFAYTGFRYVKVEGAVPKKYEHKYRGMPIIEVLEGEFIYTDVETNGEFTCSNELFNSIHKIINQSILSNMKSLLTDCPHRERLGWLEQTHLIGPSIMHNYNVHNLYKKIQMDIKDSQRENGLVPDICPEYVVFGYHEGFVDSPEWGSASIINPWHLYLRYGDITILRDYYETMKKYLCYLTDKTHNYLLHHGLGDWLDEGPNKPYSQNTPVPLVATAIYYYDIVIMGNVASILKIGEDEIYFKQLANKVKGEYNIQFFDHQTYRYATGSQTAQAMSLVFGLVEEKSKKRVLEYLIKDIENRGYKITSGDIGHSYLFKILMENNYSYILDKMINKTDSPGYGYQIKYGATTLAEEWDGPNPDNPHGSQNHLMLGGIEEWFYSGIAGIKFANDATRIIIKPSFIESCSFVNAWVTHQYGVVKVSWQKEKDEIFIAIEIPPNTHGIFINEYDLQKKELGSGKHKFAVNRYNHNEKKK